MHFQSKWRVSVLVFRCV